ncbi:MAG: hypothetical protein BGO82_02215 [Devosia sp. 67-54]|uniref:ABC transporter permease n=1 Tax=unclassified Devosia TaxID=196773 RepID=UPI0009626C87|nr:MULTISPECIES: ABC transporter permease [unclassified Devosia]MBN9305280.1 ABC transporter permease [Devosia sp.]OJX18886.1 MAG: hypothetical protein BGO82_02215 [Devosia sp. 67-54]
MSALRHDPPALRIAIVAALLFLLLGFLSILWTPYPVTSLDVAAALQDPGGAHWLGTDELGRDVLSLLMKGILTSFVVAGVAVAIGALLGVPLGLAAALLGPYAELGATGVSGYLLTLPAFVLAVLFACLFGPSAATLMVAIGIANIAPLALATRDAIRTAAAPDYVAAGRLAGGSGLDLARRHMLPTILRLILAQAIAQLAVGVLAEATLSYVGLGTQPPATSLGLLLADAQAYAAGRPGLLFVPGLALLLIALALTIVSREIRAAAGDTTGGAHGAA